jgi:hypothetical protein
MYLFLSKVTYSVSQRAKPVGLCVAYNLFIIALIIRLASRWVKDWKNRPFSSRLEIVMLNTLNVFLLTFSVVISYTAYGRWDLIEYPFSPVLNGTMYNEIQDFAVSYYIIDSFLIISKLRAAVISAYIHHFLMILSWLFGKVYPEHDFHFLEILVFLCYESTNITLNLIYLLRELNLRKTKMYFYTQIAFAASYFLLRIFIVTVAYIYVFCIWYLFPERGPSTKPSFALLALLGMWYILIGYWGVLLALKMDRTLRGGSGSASCQTAKKQGQEMKKEE